MSKKTYPGIITHLVITIAFMACSSASEARQSSTVTDNVHMNPKSHTLKKINQQKIINELHLFFSGDSSVLQDPETGSSTKAVSRIISGFEQDPPRFTLLPDGGIIAWGWQEGQAFFQSVVVFNNSGTIVMAGLADNIPRIYSWQSGALAKNMREYNQLLDEESAYSPPPRAIFYTVNQSAADKYYPLVSQWIQASLMGFNTKCSTPEQSASCQLTKDIEIPTSIYRRACKNAPSPQCALKKPSLSVAPFPDTDVFEQ